MSKGTSAGLAPTKTSINHLECIVQKRLNIKWVDAKRFVNDALHNCELSNQTATSGGIPLNRQDEIIEEACELFSDLTPEEQDRMRIQNDTLAASNERSEIEPEWKRKARIQAERREAEWQVQQNIHQNQEKLHILLKESNQTIIPEHEIPLTTIKSVRSIENDNKNVTSLNEASRESAPIVRVKTTTCYCIIQ